MSEQSNDSNTSFKKQLEELMMDFVGAYESFDEIPEAREEALTSIINLVDKEVIGEDENSKVEEQSSFSPSPTIDEHYRNSFRAKQRAIIRSNT